MKQTVVGLKDNAETYLRDYGTPLEKYGEIEVHGRKRLYYPLHKFETPRGLFWEVSQERVWVGQWIYFTCLEYQKGDRLYEWTENEMREYL